LAAGALWIGPACWLLSSRVAMGVKALHRRGALRPGLPLVARPDTLALIGDHGAQINWTERRPGALPGTPQGDQTAIVER
jgi:hypothetical protein